jgi:hypothetical protein
LHSFWWSGFVKIGTFRFFVKLDAMGGVSEVGVTIRRIFGYHGVWIFFSLPREMEVRMAQQRKASRKSSGLKKTTRTNDVSPEAAGRLAELAKEMWQLIIGGDGVPVWGTKFSEIESDTEKFWTDEGDEGVLQLKADSLSDSDPMREFWTRRQSSQAGLHRSSGRRKTIAA